MKKIILLQEKIEKYLKSGSRKISDKFVNLFSGKLNDTEKGILIGLMIFGLIRAFYAIYFTPRGYVDLIGISGSIILIIASIYLLSGDDKNG